MSDSLDDLAAIARQYASTPLSANTQRNYGTDWRQFREWCEMHRLPTDPPTSESVRLYLAQGAVDGRSAATLERRLSGISAGISGLGHNGKAIAWHESVRSVLRGVKRDKRSKGEEQKRATPMLLEDVRAMCAAAGNVPADLRDKALLWMHFATGLRRSEIAALELADVAVTDRGLEVRVRRSKTDQEGKGSVHGVPFGSNPEACPVAAWLTWLDSYGESTGCAFPALTGRGTVRRGSSGPHAMTGRAVNEMTKRRADAAGLEGNWTGNSARRGYATHAKSVGAPDEELKRHGRWVKDSTMQKYVDKTDPWVANPAMRFGI